MPLLAAIEIVSPANKDRPENRRAFAAKCAALLRQGVAVSILDVVTARVHRSECSLNRQSIPIFPSVDAACPLSIRSGSALRRVNAVGSVR